MVASKCAKRSTEEDGVIQAYLAHKKLPPPLGSPYGPRLRPTLGSQEGAVSSERGTPVVDDDPARCAESAKALASRYI